MSLPNKGPLLSLDLGSHKTGVALTDAKQTVVFMRDEIRHGNDRELLMSALKQLHSEVMFVGLVIGLPRSLSGEETEQTLKTRHLAEKIAQTLDLPLKFVDERWTSLEAARRKSDKEISIDSHSAQIILESHLGF
jgi:putative Holliday junction resolvase